MGELENGWVGKSMEGRKGQEGRQTGIYIDRLHQQSAILTEREKVRGIELL